MLMAPPTAKKRVSNASMKFMQLTEKEGLALAFKNYRKIMDETFCLKRKKNGSKN